MAEERKRKGRHTKAAGPMINWAGLPVFSLVGGAALARLDMVRRLRARLSQRGLDLAVLPAETRPSPHTLSLAARHHDLVIVDGPSPLPLVRIKLAEPGTAAAGEIFSLPGPEFAEDVLDRLVARLDDLVNRTPVWACILIGGKSSRMGRPKHLIAGVDGRTWLERTIDLLRPLVAGIVVSGQGRLPEPVADTIRLADIPGVAGPLAGILSACRFQPQVSWLVAACDMPEISAAAVQWLLADRRAGCWGRVPHLAGSDHCEALFAWYDCRAARLFEEQFSAGRLRIGEVAGHGKIATPIVPAPLQRAFVNVNTPAELAAVNIR